MKIKIDTTGVKSSKWYEFVLRFLFGGMVTALAGFAAKKFGPEIGGLFLAFPAIAPATATLIKKREQEKKSAPAMRARSAVEQPQPSMCSDPPWAASAWPPFLSSFGGESASGELQSYSRSPRWFGF